MNKEVLLIIGCLLMMVAIYLSSPHEGSSSGEKDAASLINSIRLNHRPRVLYFYATWCGACRQYGPVLKSVVADYKNSIDFQSVDVGDSSYMKLIRQYQIQSIPATFILDCYGERIFGQVGYIDRQSLTDILAGVSSSLSSEPPKKTAAK